VELRVVQAVHEVSAARSGGCQADSELARELRVSAGRERRGFLVSHVNEADFVASLSQSFHDPIDAVARQPEDRVNPAIDQNLDQNVGSIHQAAFLFLTRETVSYAA